MFTTLVVVIIETIGCVIIAYCITVMFYVNVSRNSFSSESDNEIIRLIISLSFGTRKTSDVILMGNELLAKTVFRISRLARMKHMSDHKKHALPIIAVQEEIVRALEEIYSTQCCYINYEAKSRVRGKYQGAFEVIENIILHACPISMSKIIIVVHPAMAVRVSMIARRLGLDFTIKTTEKVYDKKSDQLWTRYSVLFYFLEPIKYAYDFWRTREYAKIFL